MSKTNRPRVANPIAIRRFGVVGEPDREIVLTIGKPRPYRDSPNEWTCAVLVEGIPNAKRERVHGIDALQALQLGVEQARRLLDASGLVLTWLDGLEPGDVGISRIVPSGWGLAFERKIERHMDREAQRAARAAIAKGRRSERR